MPALKQVHLTNNNNKPVWETLLILYLSLISPTPLFTYEPHPYVPDTELRLKPTQRRVYLVKWSLVSSYLPCKVLTIVEKHQVTAHNIQEKAKSY